MFDFNLTRVKLRDYLELKGYKYSSESFESREPLLDIVCYATGNVYCFNTVKDRAYPNDNYTAEAMEEDIEIQVEK